MKGLLKTFVSHNYNYLVSLLCSSNSLIRAGYQDTDILNDVIAKMLEEDEKNGTYSLYSEEELEFFIKQKFSKLRTKKILTEYTERKVLRKIKYLNNNALNTEEEE